MKCVHELCVNKTKKGLNTWGDLNCPYKQNIIYFLDEAST
jgi:hypothetical protein